MEAIAPAINGQAVPRPAKVLLVAPAARGGLAQHVISLLSGLHGEGYQLGVACEAGGPIAKAAQEREVAVCEIAVSGASAPSRAALAAAQLARAIGHLPAQIVHTHSFNASVVGALAVRIAGQGRLLATLHNYPPAAEGLRPRRAHHRWALRMALRRARKVIAVSEALRRDLVETLPELAHKTITIPNGVDIHTAPSGCPAEVRAEHGLPHIGPLVGMIARLAPQKGIHDFIHAARLVADALPSAQLVLAGDGPLKEEALSLHEELGLGERLRLLGEVQPTRDLISALDLLVVASTSEVSSLAAMEAMALGRPVVATSVGGVPEIVAGGETGLLVEPANPQALAQAVLTLLADPDRAGEMGEQGRRRAVAHFDIRQMVERTRAAYADLLREELPAGGAST
jgi:glycosyltransferase involved in cell wall biosynthesis